MWIVSIYLIESTAPHQELTYFSAHNHEPGEIVKLIVRSRASYGLVTKCESAIDAKQTVRNAGFTLQKITGNGNLVLTKEFLHAVFEIAAYHATSAGAVLSALVPAAILEKLESIHGLTAQGVPLAQRSQGDTFRSPTFAIDLRGERVKKYVSIAKNTLTQTKSVLIIAPTIVEAERIASHIPKSIVFHGGLSKKRILQVWNSVATASEAIVTVGTPSALSLPRSNWGEIILERILARGYERSSRPFIDVRFCAEKIAEATGAALIIGSPVLPIKDAPGGGRKLEVGEWRDTKVEIIDMRPKIAESGEKLASRIKFGLFSERAKEKITATINQNQNVLLITARRGLAPHTSCDDCGTPLSCPQCSSGLVLHEKIDRQQVSINSNQPSFMGRVSKRWFECHYCGFTEKVNILCPICGSWRLSMHGIGLTLIVREAEKLFPKTKVLVADDDVADHSSAARKFAAQFAESNGIIATITERMLAYMNQCARLSVIVSIDSMLFVPEYSAPERALAFLGELRGLSDELIVQTRVPEHPVIAALSGKGDSLAREGVAFGLTSYYERELELRKKFHYPPYATLIRLTVSGTPQREKAQIEAILKALNPFHPFRFPARSKRHNMVREHILIRLPQDDRSKRYIIEQKLLLFIRSLPPSIEVRVNPKNILSD